MRLGVEGLGAKRSGALTVRIWVSRIGVLMQDYMGKLLQIIQSSTVYYLPSRGTPDEFRSDLGLRPKGSYVLLWWILH